MKNTFKTETKNKLWNSLVVAVAPTCEAFQELDELTRKCFWGLTSLPYILKSKNKK